MVVIIFPTKSRKVGITKYTIATIRRHIIAMTCVMGLTTFRIKNSVFVHTLLCSGIQTTAYSLRRLFSMLLKKQKLKIFLALGLIKNSTERPLRKEIYLQTHLCLYSDRSSIKRNFISFLVIFVIICFVYGF